MPWLAGGFMGVRKALLEATSLKRACALKSWEWEYCWWLERSSSWLASRCVVLSILSMPLARRLTLASHTDGQSSFSTSDAISKPRFFGPAELMPLAVKVDPFPLLVAVVFEDVVVVEGGRDWVGGLMLEGRIWCLFGQLNRMWTTTGFGLMKTWLQRPHKYRFPPFNVLLSGLGSFALSSSLNQANSFLLEVPSMS